MRYTLILLLFLFSFSFGQYGNQLITNSLFNDATGWTLAGTAAIGSGVLSITGDGSTGNWANITIGSFTSGDKFRVKYEVTANNLSASGLYTGGNNIDIDETGGTSFTAPLLTVGDHIIHATATGAATLWRFRTTAAQASGTISFDSLYIWQRVDTLWVDGTNGSDTDADTVQTLTEAFETRGSHSSGYFKILPGTYSESITIDSSFTKIFTNGIVNITQVDFNNKACTVDGCFNISTKLNGGSVTYINSCSEENIFKRFKRFKGFKK